MNLSPLFGWFLTPHAEAMMEERGVTPAEIADIIINPVTKEPIEGGEIYWSHASGIAWRRHPHAVTPDRYIETVLLTGPGQATWEDEARYLVANYSNANSVLDVVSEFAAAKEEAARKPVKKKGATRKPPRNGPVVVSSRFDGISPYLLDSVRDQLEKLGRNRDDLSVVRREGNKLIIEI